MEQNLEEILRKNIQVIINETVNKEIEQRVEDFKRYLEDRKDDYVAEIMKGIRLYHERDMGSLGINYKIVFENVYRLERN